ncbi:MAG: hypothetical protein ACREXT_02990, partial [Gammaproteobacteria bacterium]
QALQGAVMQFYDTLDAAVSNDARLRFGFVPYSSAVNITNILPDLPDDYLADDWTYRTKIANYDTPEYVADPVTTVTGPVWQYYDNGNTGVSQSNCLRYMKNQSFGSYSAEATNQGGPAPTPTKVISFPHDGAATSGDEWGYAGAPVNGSSSKSCRRKRTTTTTTYATWYKRTNWVYGPEKFDTSAFKNRTSVTLARSGDGRVKVAGQHNAQELLGIERENVSTSNYTWNGCIEERKTVFDTAWSVSGGEISPKNIDGDAWDLSIDDLPTDDKGSKWGPAWDDVTYRSGGTNPASNYCPVSMLKLADDNERSRGSVQTYIDSLSPVGNTYHDIGLMWGARLMSPTGIFAASNAKAPNGRAIDRNIVFMTDGEMAPTTSIYASYGIEDHDKRIVGSGSMNSTELAARHNARLQAICDALKQRNINLWVVSYSLTVTPELATCSPDKTYSALNKDALNNVFRDIAKRI